MAKGILVSLYDGKAETWSPPSCADSKAAAIRQFDMLVNDRQQTLVSMHPEDFSLFILAEFSDFNINPVSRVSLANGVDVKRSAAPSEPITREIPKGAR